MRLSSLSGFFCFARDEVFPRLVVSDLLSFFEAAFLFCRESVFFRRLLGPGGLFFAFFTFNVRQVFPEDFFFLVKAGVIFQDTTPEGFFGQCLYVFSLTGSCLIVFSIYSFGISPLDGGSLSCFEEVGAPSVCRSFSSTPPLFELGLSLFFTEEDFFSEESLTGFREVPLESPPKRLPNSVNSQPVSTASAGLFFPRRAVGWTLLRRPSRLWEIPFFVKSDS